MTLVSSNKGLNIKANSKTVFNNPAWSITCAAWGQTFLRYNNWSSPESHSPPTILRWDLKMQCQMMGNTYVHTHMRTWTHAHIMFFTHMLTSDSQWWRWQWPVSERRIRRVKVRLVSLRVFGPRWSASLFSSCSLLHRQAWTVEWSSWGHTESERPLARRAVSCWCCYIVFTSSLFPVWGQDGSDGVRKGFSLGRWGGLCFLKLDFSRREGLWDLGL